MSLPDTLTSENLSCVPTSITWLQFSTFLNGILIGGLVACFQLIDPGKILSNTSKSAHLHAESKRNQTLSEFYKVGYHTHFRFPNMG